MVVYVICRMGFIISDEERDVNQSVSETCFLILKERASYKIKPSGRIAMRRKGRCCRRQPAAGGVSVFAGYFFILKERASYKIKPSGRIAMRRKGRCCRRQPAAGGVSVFAGYFFMIRTLMIYPEGHVRIDFPDRGSAVRCSWKACFQICAGMKGFRTNA